MSVDLIGAGLWAPAWAEQPASRRRPWHRKRERKATLSGAQRQALVILIESGPMRQVPRGMLAPSGRIFPRATLHSLQRRGLVVRGLVGRGKHSVRVHITKHGRELVPRTQGEAPC